MKWLYVNLGILVAVWDMFHKHKWVIHVQNPTWETKYINHRSCDTCFSHQQYNNFLLGYLETIEVEWAWRDSPYCGHDLIWSQS